MRACVCSDSCCLEGSKLMLDKMFRFKADYFATYLNCNLNFGSRKTKNTGLGYGCRWSKLYHRWSAHCRSTVFARASGIWCKQRLLFPGTKARARNYDVTRAPSSRMLWIFGYLLSDNTLSHQLLTILQETAYPKAGQYEFGYCAKYCQWSVGFFPPAFYKFVLSTFTWSYLERLDEDYGSLGSVPISVPSVIFVSNRVVEEIKNTFSQNCCVSGNESILGTKTLPKRQTFDACNTKRNHKHVGNVWKRNWLRTAEQEPRNTDLQTVGLTSNDAFGMPRKSEPRWLQIIVTLVHQSQGWVRSFHDAEVNRQVDWWGETNWHNH